MSKINIVDARMGKGKAQPYGSLVFTKDGYKKIEDLILGESIYGEDGELHNIVGIFPQGNKEVYEVTFSDGTNTRCCKEHLWTFQTRHDRMKNKYRTEELSYFIDNKLYQETNRGDKNWNFYLPMTKPIKFDEANLIISPYALGLIIGDGGISNFGSIKFTNSEFDIVEMLKKEISELGGVTHQYRYDYRFCTNTDDEKSNIKGVYGNKIKNELNNLGLLGKKSNEKFIPKKYLMSSVKQRTELLSGLIDTDGEVVYNNIIYSTTSYKLSEDIKFLVQSLGGTCVIKNRQTYYTYNGDKKSGLPSYRLHIKLTNIQPFKSEKHKNKYKKGNTKEHRTVREITSVGILPCVCIKTSNPTGLYLTNDLIVTHNTSWAIQHMEESLDSKFVYITPFLTEVKRIKDNCADKKFREPINFGNGKQDNLHDLLASNSNVVSTHALFRASTELTMQLIEYGEYTLILDEVMDVIEQVKLKRDDLNDMKRLGYITVDDRGVVLWNEDATDYQGAYDEIREMARNKTLFLISDVLLMWNFPTRIFNAFKEVYILTYMFDGQIQRYYYDMHDVEYSYNTIIKNNTTNLYEIKNVRKEELREYDNVSEISDKINILTNSKLNNVGDGKFNLSSTWYTNNSSTQLMDILSKNISNYFRNIYKSRIKSNDLIWTTFKSKQKKLSGVGYTKGFIPCNIRATNDYGDRHYLAYCVNIFLNPIVVKFFDKHGVQANEDLYALSEMLQWIWRSAIRNNESINIYIPSSRMRFLLQEYLGQELM